MDGVFRALADPNRRRLLDSLNARNGQTLRELCSGLEMARQSVSKHLAVLERANVVTTVRRGREKLHYLNAAPINDLADRWITQYHRARVHALADLKRALEVTAMQKPSFLYTTYIRTTPERLWRGLTDPDFTRRYWGATFESDWRVGSTYDWHQDGATIADPDQVILESDPYRRLSYAWHAYTPEWANARIQRGIPRQGRQRAAYESDLRPRANRRNRQAHRHPRRLRIRQHRAPKHHQRLAPNPVRAQDAARNRRTPPRHTMTTPR
jgi:DNA-binding transcriptional ArsR family regulator